MKITADHWLEGVKRDAIPGGADMLVRRFLIIHFTAGATGKSSINYWRERGSGICAHFVIERDGSIAQCRPCNRTAGHAGASSWADPNTGITHLALNRCSIGIELANGGHSYPDKFTALRPTRAIHKNESTARYWETYDPRQIAACKALSKALVERYNLDDVVGHEDVAPRRKTDPGPAFPMLELRQHCGLKGLPTPNTR